MTVIWMPGQRVITRDGTQAVVIGHDAQGNVIGLSPFRSVPSIIRPVGDAWGGEADCELRNAA